jgi:hypothetical protein
MKILLLLGVGLLLGAVTASGQQPNCSQIDVGFCASIPECGSRAIQWRGSCNNYPPDLEWRCVWTNCAPPYTPTEYGDWVPCTCSGSGCDCLLSGTQITLADGSTKSVESIQVGDQVLGFDEKSKSMKPAVVTATHAPFETDHYYILNGTIRMTEAHPVLSGGKWVAVADLRIGDPVTGSRGNVQRIFSMEEVHDGAPTYNFQVSGGTYVAGGIVVHNKENCEHFQQWPDPN